MILPTKRVSRESALLSVGGSILRVLHHPKTVSQIWADMRKQNSETLQIRFDWFVLALDLLFSLGAIELVAGRVRSTGDQVRK